MRVPKLVGIACLITMPLAAQDAVIKGRVTSQAGEPLGGANVLVANTNTGAVTDASGAYTLTIGAAAVRGQQVVLQARYIGHKPMSRTVTLTAGERNAVAAALLDLTDGVETSETVRQCLRLLRAALVGKSNGFPGGPIHFRSRADDKDRITATSDADGNRTAITTDAT